MAPCSRIYTHSTQHAAHGTIKCTETRDTHENRMKFFRTCGWMDLNSAPITIHLPFEIVSKNSACSHAFTIQCLPKQWTGIPVIDVAAVRISHTSWFNCAFSCMSVRVCEHCVRSYERMTCTIRFSHTSFMNSFKSKWRICMCLRRCGSGHGHGKKSNLTSRTESAEHTVCSMCSTYIEHEPQEKSGTRKKANGSRVSRPMSKPTSTHT